MRISEKYKFVYVQLLTLFLVCIGCSKNSTSDNTPTINYYASKYTHLMAGNRVWHHDWVPDASGWLPTFTYLPDTTLSITVINDSTILTPLSSHKIHLVYTNYDLLQFRTEFAYKNSGWFYEVYYHTLLNTIIMNKGIVSGGIASVDSFKTP